MALSMLYDSSSDAVLKSPPPSHETYMNPETLTCLPRKTSGLLIAADNDSRGGGDGVHDAAIGKMNGWQSASLARLWVKVRLLTICTIARMSHLGRWRSRTRRVFRPLTRLLRSSGYEAGRLRWVWCCLGGCECVVTSWRLEVCSRGSTGLEGLDLCLSPTEFQRRSA